MITYLVSQNYFLKLKEHYISQVLFEIDFSLIGVYVLFRKKKDYTEKTSYLSLVQTPKLELIYLL